MIARKDFIEKLSEWLSYETCDALAFEAEQRFAETDDMSVYELMLILMASGDADDFKAMCEDSGIFFSDDDDIIAMYKDMVNVW